MIGDDAPKSAKGSSYSLSYKAQGWVQKSDERSDYVFENEDGRILLSNSFCDDFQEQPLEKLAHKTFRTVGEFKPNKGDYTTFNKREAYRLAGKGTVDGVKVVLRLLNTRRNNCYYDFVSITPEAKSQEADPDFETFLGSVEFK